MFNSPLVSIITVTYNAEDYILRTIKSITNQSYKKIEFILIDGDSKDGTIQIITNNIKDISYFISEPDANLYDAMNKGLNVATGEYVLFMNAGDCMTHSDSLLNMMRGNAHSDLIYSNARYINENKITRLWHRETPKPSQLTPKHFLTGMIICHQCMVVKKSIAPMFSTKWKVSADLEWAIKVVKKANCFHYSNEVFCLYLEGGISANGRIQNIIERFSICVKHFGIWETVKAQFRIVLIILTRGY